MSKAYSCKVPDEWATLIDQYCDRHHLSKSDFLKDAIANHLGLTTPPDPTSTDEKLDRILAKLAEMDERIHQLEEEPQQAMGGYAIAYLEASTAPPVTVNRVNPEPEPVYQEAIAPPPPPRKPSVNPTPDPVNRGKPSHYDLLSVSELCRLKGLDESAIAHRAAQIQLPIIEALELQTGWKWTGTGFKRP